MTPLQQAAWDAPFLDGEKIRTVPVFIQPRRGWYVGLSINL